MAGFLAFLLVVAEGFIGNGNNLTASELNRMMSCAYLFDFDSWYFYLPRSLCNLKVLIYIIPVKRRSGVKKWRDFLSLKGIRFTQQ
jgi:hypothetical protein